MAQGYMQISVRDAYRNGASVFYAPANPDESWDAIASIEEVKQEAGGVYRLNYVNGGYNLLYGFEKLRTPRDY